MISKRAGIGCLLLTVLLLQSCSRPKFRMGTMAVRGVGEKFVDPYNLGTHGTSSEKNGLVYTCKAGHLDIAHIRKAADWAQYLAKKSYKAILKNKKSFKFRFEEPSVGYVKLYYPKNWDSLDENEKQKIARQTSNRLGCYLAYKVTTWHEIITWFGYKITGFYTEFPSAFSWEDSFSNLLGAYVASVAFNDKQHSFNTAVTIAIEDQLESLSVQSRNVAEDASEQVKGKWYSDMVIYIDMKKRNFDIGIDDGYVTPVLIDSVSQCTNKKGQLYLAPTIDYVRDFGFNFDFEIDPKIWEKTRILKVVYPDEKIRKKRINPAKHFPIIMSYIKTDAKARLGISDQL